MKHRDLEPFFCASCKSERIVGKPLKIKRRHIAQILLLTFATMVISHNFHFKGLYWFVFYWIAFEIGFRLELKKRLICPYCGFNPTQMTANPKLAQESYRQFWTLKSKDNPSLKPFLKADSDLIANKMHKSSTYASTNTMTHKSTSDNPSSKTIASADAGTSTHIH